MNRIGGSGQFKPLKENKQKVPLSVRETNMFCKRLPVCSALGKRALPHKNQTREQVLFAVSGKEQNAVAVQYV